MNKTVIFQDWGLVDYKQAWDKQEKLFDVKIRLKAENRKPKADRQKPLDNHLIFCEHPHVFTLGKSGDQTNLLINEDLLKQKGASFYRINRGGDITYHGPGQIVGYPILDLENFEMGIKEYIFKIEESIIRTLKGYQIYSSRLAGATGVWLDADQPGKTRKICAIGVRASRHISMHGFAFNVNTDLSYYDLINPCGFTDKGVTSMEKELGHEQSIAEVKKNLLESISKVFGMKIKS
ncbi:MAG: lipoyl(octanoyl) transferase LipB [Bacteroidales bacterium]|nr:lipoyl(octanoyl) transferase LipB [Bacteroidales bacterium]MCF8344891.1 lipoyl(octanoyl) transferase LipB [Bacteroidales bacterium]MCF8350432.1 lipoyl(octanoyl) transferase LipB [Bacteroidales bacterium]MCF8377683.1 lipoyl(octanoyl) transferase LipB [Bacteroidales bacterium]MCF8401959.1 lipoyl(octanoyl) transferase LipB [Bacteroidales bacterium]